MYLINEEYPTAMDLTMYSLFHYMNLMECEYWLEILGDHNYCFKANYNATFMAVKI